MRLKGSEPQLRIKAAECLGRLGVRAVEGLSALLQAAKSPDAQLAAAASKSIDAMLIHPRLRPLLEQLTGDDLILRIKAAEELGIQGAQAAQAVPLLLESAQADEKHLAAASMEALVKIEIAPASPAPTARP